MIFEICIVIATIVFVILVVYIICTLVTVQRSLNRLTDLAVRMESRVDPILQNTEKLSDSVNTKLEAFDPLFETVNDLSCALRKTTRSYCEKKNMTWQSTITEVIELAAVGIILWQQMKKRR
jgi:uncharacterized protein YoxC